MKKKANARTVAKYIFLAATIVICVGLCVGSLLPGETSAATSDNFGGAVEGVLDDIGVSTGDVMDGTGFTNWQLFVRKLFGHFGAFMFLGVLASVTFLLFSNGSWRSRLTAFAGAAVFGFTFACLTELLQTDLFTTGRGASFDDVITDCRGYFLSALPILVICLVVLAAKEISAARKYGALLKEKDEYLRPAAPAAADIEEAETPAGDRQNDAPSISPDKTDDKDGNVTNT